jgi:hypothetical protein
MYAWEFGRTYRSPGQYVKQLDKLMMYLGRYGKQNVADLQHEPTVRLLGWADALHELMEEERRQAKAPR